MAQNTGEWLYAPILKLGTTDSTNNYAMQLIDADKAQPGTTIVANGQTKGKGQRGNAWQDVPGESLLMSLIVQPPFGLDGQFPFSAAAAVAVADVLHSLDGGWDVAVKWPNDIMVNAKKAGGILIENVLRGQQWLYAVVGLGLNVRQGAFPPELPHATSLRMAAGREYDMGDLLELVRGGLLQALMAPPSHEVIMDRYNGLLFRKGCLQVFTGPDGPWEARIEGVSADGELQLRTADGSLQGFRHGSIGWQWD